MRAFLAVLFLCLAVPSLAEAKVSRLSNDELRTDSWLMAQGGSAADVIRSARCPPLCSRGEAKDVEASPSRQSREGA
jgi:hypothetical protein